ncbi:hypothetical protein [Lewinella sp. 4G2]|uniref:hypothetical protein n=1 Tax=Lewinella sp. 4G2 TaxID=1803372 RepID=UPI0007B4BCDF|nr:hypothetical protein [Lewinella sp. 4G2]OAV43062.1 hypothetical protein A3850_000460 [Lewinella sp. 4G2]
MKQLLYLLPFLILATACDGRRDIRDYYFPARELVNTDGKVYVYENTGTMAGPDSICWYYLGVDLDTALYLSVTRYGPDLSPQQLAREEVTNDGIRLRKLDVFGQDTAGVAIPTKMDILFDRSFPFYLEEEPDVYGYRMRGQLDPASEAITYISLERRFRGDTTVEVFGGTHDALVFDLLGEVSLRDPEEGDISPQFSGYEIYAQGIGLTEYFRDLGPAGTLGGKLRRTSLMRDFAEARLPR